jgi:hypothetical protein
MRLVGRLSALIAGTWLALLPGAALAATLTVEPSTVAAGGTVEVLATCGTQATAATLSGTSFGGPAEIPLTTYSAGGPGAFSGSVTIPTTTAPGTYELSVACSDGESGTGALVVSPTGTNAGGGSTSAGPDTGALAVGAGLLALGAGGLVLLARRRAAG